MAIARRMIIHVRPDKVEGGGECRRRTAVTLAPNKHSNHSPSQGSKRQPDLNTAMWQDSFFPREHYLLKFLQREGRPRSLGGARVHCSQKLDAFSRVPLVSNPARFRAVPL